MKVEITARVTENYDTIATGYMDIKATPEGLACIDWNGLCAGLVEGVLAEAMNKQDQEEDTDE